ncbi:SGNH/GDSL hydrolase family protein [Sphingomonas oligophenolica]|uniref:SGNH/GDSL hydrolase family protein n=1 Tax=Sphingomonas oligophenolica TaxID=301154 RepID=A0ABU9Y717_9SPHN
MTPFRAVTPAVRLAACLAALAPLAAQAAPPARQVWTRSWEAVPSDLVAAPAAPDQPVSATGLTFRMTARLSAGGTAIRLNLSNELSSEPLTVGAVHVALAGPDGEVVPGSDHVVTFGDNPAPVIPAGAPLLSDPVAFRAPPLARVVVSVFLPGDASRLTAHSLGVSTTRIAPGDQSAAAALPGALTRTSRFLLSGIDVAGGPATATIVTLGDSITDGAASSNDSNHRWPDFLAERLRAGGKAGFAVANAGLSGNRLLATGAGPAALARLDRDVLSVPGVRYVVILEGVNDIGNPTARKVPLPTPEELIGAYRQIIARAHDRGIKVIGATILPYKGAGYYSDAGNAVRSAVNTWIRAPGHFDGVIDFDRITGDKADPLRMAPAYDSGDKLHPGDDGYRAMAMGVDLGLFR